MTEILSQNEIDELLQALNSGETHVKRTQNGSHKKEVGLYDFRRPHKFSQDQLRTMQVIYDSYSRLMASHLSGVLRSFCQATVVSVEPQAYYEFINSLPDPVVLGIIDFKPLEGSVIIEISPDIAFAIIEKILGGNGRFIHHQRDFTEIEIMLLQRLIHQLVSLMNEPWDNVIQAGFRLNRIETNPQFAQIVSPNETIAIITINVSVGETEGTINICIPHMIIEPISEQLSTRHWFSSSFDKSKRNKSDLVADRIRDTYVSLKALLGMTKITVAEFMSLQVGDVIKLEQPAKEEIVLVVEGQEKYLGIVGTKNNRYAVQVTGRKGGRLEDE